MRGSAGTIRVLHVDDDPDIVDLASSYLEREDDRFAVQTATTTTAAEEILASEPLDCVVSDYDMPGMDGIEFLERVRGEFPDLPFILYTGKGSEEVAAEAIAAGTTDYLQKEQGTEQYAVLANRIANAVESHWSRRALAERNRTLRRYERMINSIGEAACIYDPDGRFEIVNEYLADWLGTTREALEGQESKLVPMIRAQADGDPFQELLDGEREEYNGEITATFPGRGEAVLEYRLRPLRIDGAIDGVAAVSRDITDRREREKRLQESTARLEALFAESPDMINVHDSEGQIIDPNPQLVDALGYSTAELTDMKVWDVDQAMDPDTARSLWSGMEPGDRERLEGRYERSDGSTFPVEVHVRRLKRVEDDRFLAISRDVSEWESADRSG